MPQHSHFLLKTIANYQTGGTCARLFEPASLEELREQLKEIRKNRWPLYLLGGGTNSLVLDTPWEGAVISFRELKQIAFDGENVHCGAGVTNSDLCALALERGLSGLEWMNRLPGQLGGTVRMNARCYGGEISHVVESVRGISREGEEKTYLPKDGIFRGYKDTLFMSNDFIITDISLKLKSGGDRVQMLEKMKFCESDREQKGHFQYPSCGCVFKNNYDPEVSISSGVLLEKAGAKGLNKGKAIVSPKHANFIYNTGGASSSDILNLALEMRERVWDMFGVWLEFEMELLGTVAEDLRARVFETRTPAFKRELLSEIRAKFNARLKESGFV